MINYIYNSHGSTVAYIQGRYVYTMHGDAVGQIVGETHVHRLTGPYVGELHKGMIVDKHLGNLGNIGNPGNPGNAGNPGNPGNRGDTDYGYVTSQVSYSHNLTLLDTARYICAGIRLPDRPLLSTGLRRNRSVNH